MGKNDARKSLNGFHAVIREGALVLTASDGHRFARITLDLPEAGAEFQERVLVREHLDKLVKLCGVEATTDVRHVFAGDAAADHCPDLARALLHGQTAAVSEMGFNVHYLADAGKAAAMAANPQYHGGRFEFTGANTVARLVVPTEANKFACMSKPAMLAIMPMRL